MKGRRWVTLMFLMVMLVSPAISKDFGILTRMLYAAFLAEQGVALCTVADPAFATETRGPMGYMRDYAQHIKAEVTAGLNETETLSLLKSAADRAKAEALQALRSLRTEKPEGPEIETARITGWCQTVVKPLVLAKLLIRMTPTTPKSISYSKKQRRSDQQPAASCVTVHLRAFLSGFNPFCNPIQLMMGRLQP